MGKTENLQKKLIVRQTLGFCEQIFAGFRSEGRPIVHNDETYVHSNHTKPFLWTSRSSERDSFQTYYSLINQTQ